MLSIEAKGYSHSAVGNWVLACFGVVMSLQNKNTIQKAVACLKVEDRDAARKILIEILKKDINNAVAWFLLSIAVQSLDQKEYALHQVLRIYPENLEIISRLGELQKEDYKDDITQIKIPPFIISQIETPRQKTGHSASLLKAKGLIASGESSSARLILREILKNDPDQGDAWFLLGEVAGTQRESRAFYRQALRVEPGHVLAKNRLTQFVQPVTQPALSPLQLAELKKNRLQGWINFAKYAFRRALALLVTVAIGIYITILVANLGGYVDEIFKAQIQEAAGLASRSGPLAELPNEERDKQIQEMILVMERAMGLHDPFLLRTLRWFIHGITLNLGDTYITYFSGGVIRGANRSIQLLVFRTLPYTLLLVGVSNMLVFLFSVSIALFLSQKYGSWMDRLSAVLASFGAIPSWIIGIILVVILVGELKILPFPKLIDLSLIKYDRVGFIRLVAVQMITPVLAIFLSVFIQSVYSWRTFFLMYSQEDYVEMAKAKGISNVKIERNYIFRPTLPYVITSFSLMVITAWEAAIALEVFFSWPGIGPVFLRAAKSFNTSLIIAIVIIFAYLLALSVFVLDLVYGIVDPRIRFHNYGQRMKAARPKRTISRRLANIKTEILVGYHNVGSGLRSFLKIIKTPLSYWKQTIREAFGSLLFILRELKKYPSAIVGLLIIIFLCCISIYTMVTIPYQQAVEFWIPHNLYEDEVIWDKNPRTAAPQWTNYFRLKKLPETIILTTKNGQVVKTYETIGKEMTDIKVSFNFEYPYEDFPDEMSLFINSHYDQKLPHLTLKWITPDGREINIGSFSVTSSHIYRFAKDEHLERKFKGVHPIVGLFADPNLEDPKTLKGIYELQVSSIVFEEGSDIDIEFILYGHVHGIAGTDHLRRDLSIALLWGTPVALAFGLLGAIGTSLLSMWIAACGVWFGGWVDNVIQRITEVNIILPTLPMAIMIYIMYSKTIWAILGVIILLNIFGSSMKSYRAAFLQVKESTYVEGAMAYGAGGRRIIVHYLVPRIIPVLLPQIVFMVPGYVYFEATLAYLGLSDPYLPTWGKMIYDALTHNAQRGYYYWILEPVGLLIITGLAFALFGFALDRIINPRLREI